MKKKLLSILFFLCLSNVLFSQKDSLRLDNNEIIIGEIQSMDQSILIFKTSFSDSDFKIKWWKVREIYSKRDFIITLSNGKRFYTSINSDSINKKLIVLYSLVILLFLSNSLLKCMTQKESAPR